MPGRGSRPRSPPRSCLSTHRGFSGVLATTVHLFDLSAAQLHQLKAGELWPRLRRFDFEDVRRGTREQWFAVLLAVLRDEPARLKRHGRSFSALFLSREELQTLDAEFELEIKTLRENLAQEPKGAEPVRQLGDRYFSQLEWLMFERFAGRLNGLRLPKPRGPRPRPVFKAKKRPGRPTTITPEVERAFLKHIDSTKARAAKDRRRLSDRDALLLVMFAHYRKFLKDPSSEDVKRLEKAIEESRLFRTRRVLLARLRSRSRKPS